MTPPFIKHWRELLWDILPAYLELTNHCCCLYHVFRYKVHLIWDVTKLLSIFMCFSMTIWFSCKLEGNSFIYFARISVSYLKSFHHFRISKSTNYFFQHLVSRKWCFANNILILISRQWLLITTAIDPSLSIIIKPSFYPLFLGSGRVSQTQPVTGTCPSGCSGDCYPECNPTCCGSAVQLAQPPVPSGYTACPQFQGCGSSCQSSCSQSCCAANTMQPQVND